MRKKLYLFGALFLMTLAGCKQELDMTDGSETVESGDVATSQIQLDTNGIPEHITCVLNEDGKNSLDVDADVCAFGYNDAKMYKISQMMIDDAFLQNMEKGIFDDGQYTSVLPYKYWSVEDLNAEQSRFDEMEQEVNNPSYQIANYFKKPLAAALMVGKENEQPTAVGQDCIIYESDPSGLCSYVYDKDHFAKLRGKIDGKEYELSYTECVGAQKGVQRRLELQPLFPVVSGHYVYNPVELGIGENTCDVDALYNQAKDFLEKIGYGDFLDGFKLDLVYQDKESNEMAFDGVGYHFVRSMPELESSLLENFVVMDGELTQAESLINIPQEYIDILMGKDGIIGMDFGVYYDMDEALAEGVNLLSFDQITEIVSDHLQHTNMKDYKNFYYTLLGSLARQKDETIANIRLAYMPVRYENQYVYMPMWCFCYDGNAYQSYAPYLGVFAVSAIDGQIYYFNMPEVESK